MTTLRAKALAALPELAGDALPTDIQVFPPGKDVEFTLQDFPGQTFKLDVDESVAAKAQADLERLQQQEAIGKASAPFADKNHEDSEATFHPLRFYWGGSDPKSGGVRVQTQWTPFGAQLVKARAFKYFSGNFLFNKSTKKFLGLINENIGGLVNRPGFASQQAFAKADSVAEMDISSEIRRLNKTYGVNVPLDEEHPLMVAADQLAQKNATGFGLELNRLALLEPELQRYEQFLLKGADPEKVLALRDEIDRLRGNKGQVVAYARQADFILSARAYAAQHGLFELDGQLAFARTPAGRVSYAKYCGSETPVISAQTAHAKATTRAQSHGFVAKAKAYATAHRIVDECAAQLAFAATTEGRELYEDYCRSLRAA